jgi:hypothetical protein
MTYTWEQAKRDSDVAEQMGWQYVLHQARRGAGLIELKEQCPHHGPENFQSRLKVELPDLDHDTRATLMKLARYLPLLEQRRPESQADALKLIKEQQPPKPQKPKQIPVPQEQEQQEKEMPKDNFNWERIAIEEGISVAGSGGSRNIAKKEIDELDEGAIKSKDEDRLRSVCRKIFAMRNPDKAKDDAQKVKDDLPKSAQEKFDRAIAKWQAVILADVQKQFNEQLAAAKAEVQVERDAVWALKKEAEAERDAAFQYRLGVDSHMTQEEFQLVRNCLHPDRAPEDRRDRFTKAFNIFNRLEKTVNTKAPIAVLRRHGWEKVSPFHKSH